MTSSENEFSNDEVHVTKLPDGSVDEQGGAKEGVRSSGNANLVQEATGKVLSVVSNESG
jgi:hypothetical protein